VLYGQVDKRIIIRNINYYVTLTHSIDHLVLTCIDQRFWVSCLQKYPKTSVTARFCHLSFLCIILEFCEYKYLKTVTVIIYM